MKRETERETIERTCRRWLLTATQSVDAERESVYSGYRWAYDKIDGLATGLLDLYLFELYDIANYYRKVASNKMYKRHK